LVGSWQLSPQRLRELPSNVEWHPPCSTEQLREHYRQADVFLFPSHFEGFGLVLLEAMACGLPAFASDASAMPDLFLGAEGKILPAGDVDALVENLRWANLHREILAQMGERARKRAQLCTWDNYRRQVRDAVAPIL
jgi:glycosyltransferase involved in cell wall biosynthesis